MIGAEVPYGKSVEVYADKDEGKDLGVQVDDPLVRLPPLRKSRRPSRSNPIEIKRQARWSASFLRVTVIFFTFKIAFEFCKWEEEP